MEPELIADYACVVGEGPLWHAAERRLYWTDILAGRLYRYEPATGRHEQIYQGPQVGGFTVQADGALLLFLERGAIKTWREGKLETILEEIPDERASRFNDVIADPEGRVFCGTMPSPDRLGRLYRLDPDGTLFKILDGIGISNGMGFTPDLRQLYYTDSAKREIYVFDYNRATGNLTNQRVLIRTEEDLGIPDGMTVDAEGCLWSARWDGSMLVRYRPDGTEERRIQFPAKKVSCPTFGGPNFGDLYVTTAGGDKKNTDGPLAGALFRLRLGIKGVPEFVSRIGL